MTPSGGHGNPAVRGRGSAGGPVALRPRLSRGCALCVPRDGHRAQWEATAVRVRGVPVRRFLAPLLLRYAGTGSQRTGVHVFHTNRDARSASTDERRYHSHMQDTLALAADDTLVVAIRRTNLGQSPDEPNLLDVLPPDKYTLLPNTAGCYTADDAVRTCRLARELLDGHKLVKLEVLGDARTLYPDVVQTLRAAETLVADGFDVMVYTSDDPILAKRLEEIGCVAVMPLAAPIGSGLGIQNKYNLIEIIENAKVPIIVDAGVGTASDASIAMELGCDGVLMNTAIAGAKDPVLMAHAMKLAVEAGRAAFRAGRIPRKRFASASSPIDGLIGLAASIKMPADPVDKKPFTAEPGQRKVRSFVLRQGRFTPAQQRAFEEQWPRFGLD